MFLGDVDCILNKFINIYKTRKKSNGVPNLVIEIPAHFAISTVKRYLKQLMHV